MLKLPPRRLHISAGVAFGTSSMNSSRGWNRMERFGAILSTFPALPATRHCSCFSFAAQAASGTSWMRQQTVLRLRLRQLSM
jgi:hypothetical protein